MNFESLVNAALPYKRNKIVAVLIPICFASSLPSLYFNLSVSSVFFSMIWSVILAIVLYLTAAPKEQTMTIDKKPAQKKSSDVASRVLHLVSCTIFCLLLSTSLVVLLVDESPYDLHIFSSSLSSIFTLYLRVFAVYIAVSFAILRVTRNHSDVIDLPHVETSQPTALINCAIESLNVNANYPPSLYLAYYFGWKLISPTMLSLLSSILGVSIKNTLYTINPLMEAQVAFFGMNCLFMMTFAERVFDVVYTLPIFTLTSRHSTELLLTGLQQSTKPYVQICAWMDMQRLLQRDVKRRAVLFESALTDNALLTQFIKLSCAILKESSSLQNMSLKPLVSQPLAIETKKEVKKQGLALNTASGIKVPTEPINVFSATSTAKAPLIARAVETVEQQLGSIVVYLIGKLRSLLNLSKIFKHVKPSPIESVHIQLDLLVLKCLALLIEKSATEDKFGAVNAQFPAILDSILSYLSFCGVFRFNNEENPNGMTSELLRRGCVDCLYRIAKVYGEHCVVGSEANRAVMRRVVDGKLI